MSWKSKTFDGPLPALAIRGPALRQSLRIYTIATLYLTAHGVCVSGAHINSFCRMAGFADWHMGLLTSLPPLAVFFQILATLPIERTGLRKHQYIDCSLWARLGWIVVAGIGFFLPTPSTAAVWLVLMMIVTMSCLDSFAGPAGTTWIADLLPRRIRARYIAAQSTLARLLQLVLLIVVSLLLDWATAPGPNGRPIITAAAQPRLLHTICGLFLVAGLLGLSMFLFHRIREVFPSTTEAVHRPQSTGPKSPASRTVDLIKTLADVLIEPLRNRAFRQFTLCVMILSFGANVGGIYLWQNCGPANLGFSNLASNMIFMFGGTLAALLTLKPLGGLVDRFGRKPVLVVCTFAAVLGILPWAFITRGMSDMGVSAGLNWLVAAASGMIGHGDFVLIPPGLPVGAFLAGLATASFAGIAWAGVGLAQQSYLFGFSDLKGRSKYIAAFSVLASVGVMVAGVAGGAVTQSLEFLQRQPLHLGPFVMNNWHVSFVIGAAGRFLAALLMLRLPDESPRSAGDLLNYMAGWLPRLVARLYPFGGR
jgi:MFS family permease